MAVSTPKVVVIGGTYVDMAIRCDQIPLAGQDVLGSALSYRIAGPGACQVVQAALCQCQAYLIGKVGGDPFGQMIKNGLAEFDVNIDFIYTAEAKNTGTIVTLVDAKGGNTTLTYIGANSRVAAQGY